MMSMKKDKLSLRKNDSVEVITGKEKGKIGKVLKVNSRSMRITVESVSLMKRHTRPTQKKSGGIFEKEASIHYSNVLLYCRKCNKGVKHGRKWIDKKKVRFCKHCETSLEAA